MCKRVPAKASRETRYEISLKLDGSSMTVFDANGRVGVCSRNLELKIEGNESNVFVQTANKYNLFELLKGENVALQGELMGPGIQGNRENLKEHQFFVYNIYDIRAGRMLTPTERLEWMVRFRQKHNLDLPHVPILFYGTRLDQIEVTDLTSILDLAVGPSLNHKVREGLVFKALDGSHQFKVISDEYLLGEK